MNGESGEVEKGRPGFLKKKNSRGRRRPEKGSTELVVETRVPHPKVKLNHRKRSEEKLQPIRRRQRRRRLLSSSK